MACSTAARIAEEDDATSAHRKHQTGLCWLRRNMTLGEMGYGFGVSRTTGWCHKRGMAAFVTDVLGCTAANLRIVGRGCLVNAPVVSTLHRFSSRLAGLGDADQYGMSGEAASRGGCCLPGSGHKVAALISGFAPVLASASSKTATWSH